ncbi:MAG TPA: hypothetical protein VGQ09_05910 [Chitinophagaceae bacterium]|jgi:hypothetical protein|nr:hypothetical protein [Chitinophagaceae bacterium]
MAFDYTIEYIPRRMKELGYGTDYHLRIKYLSLAPSEVRNVEAYNQLLILVEVGNNAKIESEMGTFDYTDINLRENQFEHTGLITVTNKSVDIVNIQYIQVIPKIKSNASDK